MTGGGLIIKTGFFRLHVPFVDHSWMITSHILCGYLHRNTAWYLLTSSQVDAALDVVVTLAFCVTACEALLYGCRLCFFPVWLHMLCYWACANTDWGPRT